MTTPAPSVSPARYYCDGAINGFVVLIGGTTPFLIINGDVAAPWDEIPIAIRHGWTIKGGLIDGTIIVKR